MRLRINHDIDRETKKQTVNFDVYLFSKGDVDKAMKALAVIKELLPEVEPEAVA